MRETLKAQASNFVLDPRFNWKPVECSKAVMQHSHAWVYGGLFGQRDFVCAEVYSVCCLGDQQAENCNNLIL